MPELTTGPISLSGRWSGLNSNTTDSAAGVAGILAQKRTSRRNAEGDQNIDRLHVSAQVETDAPRCRY